ncbi:hypothetical protein pb186bvf_015195 [Paramecium bursaria]
MKKDGIKSFLNLLKQQIFFFYQIAMKILDELKQQVENEMKKIDAKLAQKKYMKITQSIKELFLRAVVNEKQTIKGAAQRIGINYSSAKAIWAEFKQKKQPQKEQKQEKAKDAVKRCKYQILHSCKKIKKMFMEIKTSVANKISGSHQVELDQE